MKVLQLSADWKWTGPAEPMLHYVTGLRARGHQVDLACPEPPPGSSGGLLPRARERGVEPVSLLRRGQGYVPLRDAAEVRRLRRLFAASAYDVVHVHHTRDHLLARRALRGKTPLVASWHRGERLPATLWNRWLFAPGRLDGLCVLGERLAELASEELHLPRERIAVVPGCVDTERFAPREPCSATREALGIPESARVIGVVARLQPQRRFELLLDAFGRALRDHPSLRLLVVGRGTRAREVLERPLAERGLSGLVVPAGYRSRDYREVLSLMDALAFLVPGSDGSCRAVLETMAMGIPTIATRRGLLPEIVADGTTGLIVDETAESLASALADVPSRPDLWRDRGVAARKRVLEQCRADYAARILHDFYARIVG